MKTSLVLDNQLFQAAQKEAQESGTTLSETVSRWARAGREALTKKKGRGTRKLKPANLGGSALIDLSSRRDWMDQLEDRP